MDVKEEPSKFVEILEIPRWWNQNIVTKKCTAYGVVNEVIVDIVRLVATVEFENIGDAERFMNDAGPNRMNVAYLHKSEDPKPVVVNAQPTKNLERFVDGEFGCGNPSCDHLMMKARGDVYCSPECHPDPSFVEKWNLMEERKKSRELGRNGQGLIAERRPDEIMKIYVDHRGVRSVSVKTPHQNRQT